MLEGTGVAAGPLLMSKLGRGLRSATVEERDEEEVYGAVGKAKGSPWPGVDPISDL